MNLKDLTDKQLSDHLKALQKQGEDFVAGLRKVNAELHAAKYEQAKRNLPKRKSAQQ